VKGRRDLNSRSLGHSVAIRRRVCENITILAVSIVRGEETLGGCRLNLEMFNEVKLVHPANSEMCSAFLSTGLKAPVADC